MEERIRYQVSKFLNEQKQRGESTEKQRKDAENQREVNQKQQREDDKQQETSESSFCHLFTINRLKSENFHHK